MKFCKIPTNVSNCLASCWRQTGKEIVSALIEEMLEEILDRLEYNSLGTKAQNLLKEKLGNVLQEINVKPGEIVDFATKVSARLRDTGLTMLTPVVEELTAINDLDLVAIFQEATTDDQKTLAQEAKEVAQNILLKSKNNV